MSHTWKDRKRYFLKQLCKNYTYSCECGSRYNSLLPVVPSWFKKMRTRIRRAKVKDAMNRGDYDCLPKFRRDDEWNWY